MLGAFLASAVICLVSECVRRDRPRTRAENVAWVLVTLLLCAMAFYRSLEPSSPGGDGMPY